ncbi:hypothetical protein IW147_000780 [Coemansia sp. RSA 720]|nr:hypothetical protein IW147_000780 [Coemansia sp. RSA 720]
MGDARINLTPVLRPLPQLNFRLSQQPPASLRIYSIDSDSFCESVDMDTIVDDFDTCDAEGGSKDTLDLDLRNLTPLTVSSPVLSLGSMASTNHRVARIPLSPIFSAKWQADTNTPTRKTAESLLRKFVATPPLKHRQPEAAAIYTPSLARSPLRTLSSHRQHIRPQSVPVRRPLLSQRPSIPPPCQPSEQTPSKRPRRMGATMAEFLSVASQEVSDFCTWSHCVGSESSAQLVCQRPLPDLRLNIHSIERVLSPHLFSVCASIAQVRVGHGGHLLAEGQPITMLLSFAVSLDATPQAAQQLIRQVSLLEMDSAAQLLAEDAADVTIAVYQPWRIRGEGEQMSLLASRFEIDHRPPNA